MVLNQAKELGRTIAGQQKQIDGLKQEISPNDPSASFPLFTQEQFSINKTLQVYKARMSGVYIVGNAVYGVIGATTSEITMPITMPLEIDLISAYPIGPICILDSELYGYLDDCILGDREVDQYERTLIYTTTF